jgi:hypothetical protein
VWLLILHSPVTPTLLWDSPVEDSICQYHLNKNKHIAKGVTMPLLDKAKSMFKNLLESDTQRTPITLENTNGRSTVVLSK